MSAHTTRDSENMDEYTRRELEAYLKKFYERGADYAVADAGECTSGIAVVTAEDANLYAELQGAGFPAVVPENGDGTRFYVHARDEPLLHTFVGRDGRGGDS